MRDRVQNHPKVTHENRKVGCVVKKTADTVTSSLEKVAGQRSRGRERRGRADQFDRSAQPTPIKSRARTASTSTGNAHGPVANEVNAQVQQGHVDVASAQPPIRTHKVRATGSAKEDRCQLIPMHVSK